MIKKDRRKKKRITICLGIIMLIIGIFLYVLSVQIADGVDTSLDTLAIVFTTYGSGLLALCIYRWKEIPPDQLTEESLKKREIKYLLGAAVFIVLLAIVPSIKCLTINQILKVFSVSGLSFFINLLICTVDSRMTINEEDSKKELREVT